MQFNLVRGGVHEKICFRLIGQHITPEYHKARNPKLHYYLKLPPLNIPLQVHCVHYHIKMPSLSIYFLHVQ